MLSFTFSAWPFSQMSWSILSPASSASVVWAVQRTHHRTLDSGLPKHPGCYTRLTAESHWACGLVVDL